MANSDDKRPQFGNRHLTNPEQVFQHNAWDNVEWDDEQEAEAKKKVAANSQKLVDDEQQEKYETEADRFWDEFYSVHQNRFFKDRHWLFTEFPELLSGMDKNLLTKFPQKTTESEENLGKSSGVDSLHEKIGGDMSSDGNVSSSLFSTVNDKGGSGNDKIQTELSSTSESGEKQRTTTGVSDTHEQSSNIGTCSQVKIGDSVDIQTGTKTTDIKIDRTGEKYPGENSKFRVFEVGCGVGNTVFPILETNNDPGVFVYCCDLSDTAIQLVKEHEEYKQNRCHGFVCDVTKTADAFPFPDESLDVITLIFVMSAIHPDKMQSTVHRLAKALKPGGVILFRDYGRYDLAQLRFKNGRCLSENFYVRGDGTRVYFFTQEGLRELFTSAGLEEEQNHIDRRLQVNRGKMLKMYRVWLQCKYIKKQ